MAIKTYTRPRLGLRLRLRRAGPSVFFLCVVVGIGLFASPVASLVLFLLAIVLSSAFGDRSCQRRIFGLLPFSTPSQVAGLFRWIALYVPLACVAGLWLHYAVVAEHRAPDDWGASASLWCEVAFLFLAPSTGLLSLWLVIASGATGLAAALRAIAPLAVLLGATIAVEVWPASPIAAAILLASAFLLIGLMWRRREELLFNRAPESAYHQIMGNAAPSKGGAVRFRRRWSLPLPFGSVSVLGWLGVSGALAVLALAPNSVAPLGELFVMSVAFSLLCFFTRALLPPNSRVLRMLPKTPRQIAWFWAPRIYGPALAAVAIAEISIRAPGNLGLTFYNAVGPVLSLCIVASIFVQLRIERRWLIGGFVALVLVGIMTYATVWCALNGIPPILPVLAVFAGCMLRTQWVIAHADHIYHER